MIGDSLYRTLQFLGHRVTGDNHLGDWGTQFWMWVSLTVRSTKGGKRMLSCYDVAQYFLAKADEEAGDLM